MKDEDATARGGFVQFGLDTSVVAPAERFDFWREMAHGRHAPVRSELLGPDFSAAIEGLSGAAFTLFRSRLSAYRFYKTPEQASAQGDSGCFAMLVQSGRALLTQGEVTTPVGPRDIMLFDTWKPYSITYPEACDLVCVRLHDDGLRLAIAQAGLQRVSPAEQPAAALASAYLRALPTTSAALGEVADLAAPQLTALLSQGLVRQDTSRHRSFLAAVRRLIEAEIANPDLSAKLLCRRLGVSRTTLFDALAAQGMTLGLLIRERRMEGCRADLLRSRPSSLTVAAIAERWGFRDQAALSRAFKHRFGVPPSRYRLRD